MKTATFFTAQVDFSECGDLGVFVDDDHLKLVKELSEAQGYLDGRYMATTFNMLRSNDLIWNYVVNNYLLGKDYFPFDLLYWNSDATNVPARWHGEYLEGLYRDGVSSEVVDLIVNPKRDMDNKVKHVFVFECDICHAAYEAFVLYGKRQTFQKTAGRDTFGKGVDAKIIEELKNR